MYRPARSDLLRPTLQPLWRPPGQRPFDTPRMNRQLNKRGWHNKIWTSRAGQTMGGRPFDKPTLYRLLCNVVYLGKITHGDHVYAGEHEAIVTQDLFNRVQSMLRRNKNSGGKYVRNKHNTLLKGLVRCRTH